MELFRIGFVSVRLIDVFDISVGAFLIYKLFELLKGSFALRILLALIFVIILWRIVDFFDFVLLRSVLDVFMGVGSFAVIVIFSPEIRRFLVGLGRNTALDSFFSGETDAEEAGQTISEVLDAVEDLKSKKIGGLFVLSVNETMDPITETGEKINAEISSRLLVSIFQPDSPLHDGAVVIKSGKILAARCVLPISEKPDLPADMGMRHRSGLGMSENSHALVVIISEERAEVSVALEGRLFRAIDMINVERMLRAHFKLV